jgi:serine/threonine-protein kinase
MNEQRWERVKAVFHEALDRAPTDRPAFVEQACGGDTILRAEVSRLLASHAKANTFMEWSPAAAFAGQQPPRRGVPASIGRYPVDRLLGSGGMGEVYAARDPELGRPIAIKVVTNATAGSLSTLRREAQHASQLNHPHICTIYEVGEAGGQAYVAMEYVEGQTLRDLIPKDGLAVETAVRYAIQIVDALAHAHEGGIVHRDLKTANVVVTPEGRAKVLDFGLAQRMVAAPMDEITRSRAPAENGGMVSGTLPYMAPELLRGGRGDARSDIWAFGVVLHELLAGTRPFAGATALELNEAILHQPPAPLPERVPPSLRAIAQRCLAKEPAARYRHAFEIRSALETVQAELASGHGTRASASSRWFRVAAIAGVLALGAAIASVAVLDLEPLRRAGERVAVGASGRPAIAVVAFSNQSGDADTAWLSTGIPTMVLTGLAQTPGIDIVSPQRLHDAMLQAGHDGDMASLDKAEAADVARRAGAGALITGSIFRAGQDVRIDAQVEDLSSGLLLAGESVRGTDVFALADQLAARFREGVGVTAAGGVRQITDVSSMSLSAYRLYSQGMDAAVNVRLEEAIPLFEQAVAIDPEFAEAHLRLALVLRGVGRQPASRQHLATAARHAERLSQRNRLLLEMNVAYSSGDFAAAERILNEIITRHPDVEEAYALAGNLYDPAGPFANLDKLVAITAAGTAAVPASPQIRNAYGYALLSAGRPGDALAQFQIYAQLAPREPNPFDSIGEAYLILGAPDKAAESYARAMTIDPRFPSQNSRAYALAMMGRYSEALSTRPSVPHISALLLSRVGRYREAAAAIASGIASAGGNGNATVAGGLHMVSAALALEQRDYAAVLRYTRTAQDEFRNATPGPRRIGPLVAGTLRAIATVASGQMSEARSLFAPMSSVFRSNDTGHEGWWYSLVKGEIALAEGDFEAAEQAFSTVPKQRVISMGTPGSVVSNNLLRRDGVARVAEAKGDLPAAIQAYRRLLVQGPDNPWVSVLEPRYVLQLARLLERTGDRQNSRIEYERFLNLWKDADSGLPEVAEARRALERLR